MLYLYLLGFFLLAESSYLLAIWMQMRAERSRQQWDLDARLRWLILSIVFVILGMISVVGGAAVLVRIVATS